MKSVSLTRMTQALFFFNAAIWLILGITSLLRLANSSGGQPASLWMVAILMFGNVAALLLCGWGIGTTQKGYFYLAFLVLAINILLTVTDQFGVLDLATLVIDVILLGLLVGAWKNRSKVENSL
jgi:hypothetical protein